MTEIGRRDGEGMPISGLSRRELLKTAGAGGLAIAGAGLLSACGTASTTTGGGEVKATASQTSDVYPGPPVRGGTLRHGVSGGGPSDTLDAAKGASAMDFARSTALYETLWTTDSNFNLIPWLATEADHNAAGDVWTVRLRDGVKFHDGSPMTADDVIYSFRRILDPATASPFSSSLAMIDPHSMRKIDPLTVRFQLTAPFAPFPETLSVGAYIVPVGYNPAKPVGTGPFKYESFTPGQVSVFTAFEEYWRPGHPYLGAVSHVDFADETSRLNALTTGQLDIADDIEFALVKVVESHPDAHVLVSPTDTIYAFGMRADKPPFDDVRVRQAFRLIADRPALVEGVFSGYGRIANDLYSPQDPDFDSSLPQRKQDIEEAKHLLAKAGATGLEVPLTTSDISAGIVSASELFALQAKEAGVTVTLDKLEPGAFYGPNSLEYQMAPILTGLYSYLMMAQQLDGPTSVQNSTHFKDPEFDSLWYQGIKEFDRAKRRSIVTRMQEIQYERGSLLIYAFNDVLDAYSKVGGLKPDVSGVAAYRYGDLWLVD